MSITVVLTNYKRPAHLPGIVAALIRQTPRPRIFVWDNSCDRSFDIPGVDWVVRSSRNARCAARWWLAAQADTEWVAIMDDDLRPNDQRVLRDAVAGADRLFPNAVGITGVVLEPGLEYSRGRHVGFGTRRRVRDDMHVDILKGRFFVASRQRVQSLPIMSLECEDDIVASGCFEGGVVLHALQDRFTELPTGDEAWSRRANHYKLREQARRLWVPT